MAATQVLRYALKVLAPALSSRSNAPLRPLSGVAAAQLMDSTEEDDSPLSDIRFRHKKDGESKGVDLTKILAADGSEELQTEGVVGSELEGQPGPSGRAVQIGGSVGAADPGMQEGTKLPQPSTSRQPDYDPDFFPERRPKSSERYTLPAQRKKAWSRRSQGWAERERQIWSKGQRPKSSANDPGFTHALPEDVNLRVEGIIQDISRMSTNDIHEYLVTNQKFLMTKAMYYVITRLARRGDCQRAYDALWWYRQQDFYQADPMLYHCCIYPLEPEQHYLGWKLFLCLKADECGASGTAYSQLLRLAAQSNAFWRAFEVMEDMCKYVPGRPDVRDFNNLMGTLLRSRRPIPCEKVFMKMNMSEGHFGLEPDRVSYNTLMSCYAREGHYRKVEGLLKRMQEARIQPDEYTCSTVVQAYGRANLVSKAIRAFDEMKAAGYRPNNVVYNTLVTTLSKALMPSSTGKVVQLVEKYVEMMKKDGYEPDSSTQKALLLAYSKAGQFDKAEAIIEAIHSSGQKVRPLLWHAYISGYAEMGRVEDTVKTISRFCDEGYQPGFVVRNAMMTAYAKAGNVQKAEDELAHMQADKVEIMQSACNAVLEAYARSGQIHKIAPFFKMMEEYNVPASTVTYKLLIAAYGSAGQYDMVDELMDFIRDFQHVKLVAFSQLVKTYAQGDKIAKMEEALGIINKRRIKPGKIIMAEMAAAYERAGMLDKAEQFKELLRQLEEQHAEETFGQLADEADDELAQEEGHLQSKSSEHIDQAG